MKIRSFILFFLCVSFLHSQAQQPDSVFVEAKEETQSVDTSGVDTSIKIHSPKKAAWMSAVLPGLGQGYNKKYWKIPVVYGGFVGLSYGINFNFVYYKKYRDEYRYRIENDGERQKFPNLPDENVNANKQIYQRNMEIFILVTAAWYLINILDAVVDAHLMSYDISDNLTMQVVPSVQFNHFPTSSYTNNHSPATANVSFVFNLK